VLRIEKGRGDMKKIKIGTEINVGAENRGRVEAATVRLTEKGGCGVLVPGGFILTATHCIDWSGTGQMAMGEEYPTEIKTPDGAKFRVGVLACDPVSDIAVLGELDNQNFYDDVEAFEEWRERVKPVPLSTRLLRGQQSCPVFILTHRRKWIAARAERTGMRRQPPDGSVGLTAKRIESGTSGSPIVTAEGRLYGIVSNTGAAAADGLQCGSIPVAHLALPEWVLARIKTVR
jgi:S1-C subfamily serine protease